MKERCIFNAEIKPAEAGHLPVAEYNRFYVWWEGNYKFHGQGGKTREVALKAYAYAPDNVDYGARH